MSFNIYLLKCFYAHESLLKTSPKMEYPKSNVDLILKSEFNTYLSRYVSL